MLIMPELLFLDEPTTGLDPRSRNEVWAIVRTLVAQGTTVLLTTQYLEEADQLADRLAVIDGGTVIAEGTAAELKKSVGTGSVHVRLSKPERCEEAEQLLGVTLGAAPRRHAFSVSWIFACIGVIAKKTESINSMSYVVLFENH